VRNMEDMVSLIRLAHQGDRTARDALVMNNVGLVWSIVRQFNLEYEVKFSTYAVPMITGEIKRFLRDDGMLKVSRSVKELGFRVRSTREKLTGELGREPSLEELSAQIGVSREEIAASLEAGAEVESLYKTVGSEEQGMCLMDKLCDEREEQEQLMNRMVLKQLLEQLSDKERDIIIRRYFENQTQSQIAADLEISQVQVSRLEKKILRRMREYLSP